MDPGASRAVVVGAGLGGLLSGAYLARAGYRVELFDPLAFVGGKFTSFDLDGFAVPTGAFHTLPGGWHGHIARACAELGVPLELHVGSPAFVVRRGDHRLPIRRSPWREGGFLRSLPPRDRLAVAVAMAGIAATPLLPEVTLERWLRLCRVPEETIEVLGRVVTFSIGVPLSETSVRDVGQSMWAQHWRTEGIVRGGVKSIVTALTDLIVGHGGRIHRGRGIARITVERGAARGVVTARGEAVTADLVVCCAGLERTVELLADACPASLRALWARSVPAWGASFSVRTREPLLPHSGIEVPLDSRHISGLIQLTNGAPELAPPGWHYLLAYQVLARRAFTPRLLDAARRELRGLFPGLPREAVFHISCFRGRWPAARLGQGLAHHGQGRCPVVCPGIDQLYLVSHDSRGTGFAAEVVADAARTMVRALERGR